MATSTERSRKRRELLRLQRQGDGGATAATVQHYKSDLKLIRAIEQEGASKGQTAPKVAPEAVVVEKVAGHHIKRRENGTIAKGQVLNPVGRPSAGAAIKEWWNQLAGLGEDEWRRVASDAKSPGAKRVAAQRWLDGLDGDGNQRGAALEQIISHTDGKAMQRIEQRIEQVTVSAQVHVIATDTDVMAAAQRLIEQRKSSISK